MIKIFLLSIFEWPFYTGFTVLPSAEILCEQFGPRSSPTKRCVEFAELVIIAEVRVSVLSGHFLSYFKKSFQNPSK